MAEHRGDGMRGTEMARGGEEKGTICVVNQQHSRLKIIKPVV